MNRLTEHLEKLFPSVWDEELELPLITDVLSLVDLLLTTGEVPAPKWSRADLEDLRTLLEEAVILAIEGDAEVGFGNEALDRLTDWILNLPDEGRPPLTIVSTNCDVLVESLVFTKIEQYSDSENVLAVTVDFGFCWGEYRRDCFMCAVYHPPGVSPCPS